MIFDFHTSSHGQVVPTSKMQDAFLSSCIEFSSADKCSSIQVGAQLEPAGSKFTHYISSGTTNGKAKALLVDELRRMSIFSHLQPCSGRSFLTEQDACSLFSILDSLGYTNISYHHKGTTFLTMKAVFRFTEVVLKIGWAANPPFDSDPCIREAEFNLDIQGEYGKVYSARYYPYDERLSSADVLAIRIGSSTYSVSTTQMADCSLRAIFQDMAGKAKSSPVKCFIRDAKDLLYQVLKLYELVHHRGYALIRNPSRLMMLCCRDGHGCQAVSRVEFQGKSYALMVVSTAYSQKQGIVYIDAEPVTKGLDRIDGSSINRLNSGTSSNQPFSLITGVQIAASLAQRKELILLGHNLAAKSKVKISSGDVSARRRDLQLIAATFIEILSGHFAQEDSEFDCSQALRHEELVDLDDAAYKLFTTIHSKAARNKSLGVDNVNESQQESHLAFAEASPMGYLKMPNEYKDLLKLLWRLQSSMDITATGALESDIFRGRKEQESWLYDPWRQQDIPDWSLLPLHITQNFWRRTIFPKCQHYFVKGGPYDAGGGKVLQLKAVWLVYECVGEISGHDAWQRTVRLAENGNKGDIVAVYVCPLIFKSSLDSEYLDYRWTMNIKSSDDWLFNGKTCGMFNPHIAVEKQQVACYINSSKDKQGNNHRASWQHDFCRRIFGLPKGQNCSVFYPHNWGRNISKDKLLANPWLGTIAFKLTSKQGRYAELAYPYDWWKLDSEFHLKFMKQTSSEADQQHKHTRLRPKYSDGS